MRNILFTLLLLSGSSGALLSTTAAAASSGTDVTFHNVVTVPIPTALEPCTSGPGNATVDFTAVFHITILDDGIVIVSSIMTGTFAFVPTGASEPTFTGRFVSNLETQSTPPGQQYNTSTQLIVVGTGPDGAQLTFHEITHVTRTPAGDVTVNFDRPTCASQ